MVDEGLGFTVIICFVFFFFTFFFQAEDGIRDLVRSRGLGDVYKRQGQINQGVIKEILPRKNYVVRQSPRQKHQLHLLAANVDQACVVTTIVQPNLKQGFIDRFLSLIHI